MEKLKSKEIKCPSMKGSKITPAWCRSQQHEAFCKDCAISDTILKESSDWQRSQRGKGELEALERPSEALRTHTKVRTVPRAASLIVEKFDEGIITEKRANIELFPFGFKIKKI